MNARESFGCKKAQTMLLSEAIEALCMTTRAEGVVSAQEEKGMASQQRLSPGFR
jgi:hypothetical protein